MTPNEPPEPPVGTWWARTEHHGLGYLRTLLQQLERGAVVLTIDPLTWEHAMDPLEWMAVELATGRMRGQERVTPEDVERVRRVRTLVREVLTGTPPSPELPLLIKQTLRALYGPHWERIPAWDTSLAASPLAAQAASALEQDPDGAMDRFQWLTATLTCGGAYIFWLARAVEHGDVVLPVVPSAWENAMTMLERAVLEHVRGHLQWTTEILAEIDVERVHRLRELGARALSGAPRSLDIAPLARECLVTLFGPNWKSAMPDVEAAAHAIVHGYAPS